MATPPRPPSPATTVATFLMQLPDDSQEPSALAAYIDQSQGKTKEAESSFCKAKKKRDICAYSGCGRRISGTQLLMACRCQLAFCRAHRLPHQHECTIDYKKGHKELLEAQLMSGKTKKHSFDPEEPDSKSKRKGHTEQYQPPSNNSSY